MSFKQEVSEIQLYSDELLTSFTKQVTDIFNESIVPQVKKVIKLYAIVGANYAKYEENLQINLDTILLNLPFDSESIHKYVLDVTNKLIDTHAIRILETLLEKELGKEFNIHVSIFQDNECFWKTEIYVNWIKELL